ncbi:cytochrome d ubiquinol oxidase subunit II [Caballeronia sp. LZ043]|uniref:cytochrome d ubiquinol oxidase subunit II n=1 Tax=Caballeronia sp. LZ043 TaxID=3038569 RepID=UPI0028660B9D|nr:cytochrome d ubiquinol oxidase subunit II [Caballeronia sp. LZ043]MDR5823466.1 cytochrome d ubiquinol oxidase subunit II [Caballeronia sp. LZ043]
MLDLVPLWAAILALAVFMYVLLDGFDLGVGIMFLLRRDGESRNLMINSVAPVWDFNETWLILGGGGLFAVFPLAFAIIVPAVYFPILFMLLGLIFRGVAFEFREVIGARKRLWDGAFGVGSLVATFSQGIVLGMFIQGFPIEGRVYAGTSWNWIAPFPLLTGVGMIFGYALQGTTWLVLKTEGKLQEWGRRMARYALIGVIAFILLISLWTPLKDARIAARWFDFPYSFVFAPVPVLTVLLAWTLWTSLARGREVTPFLCSMGLFFLAFTGLVISLWPFIAPPSVTLWDASTAPLSQQFLLIGTMFLLPVLIIYVVWSYWVFRGKVRGDMGYHAE